MENQCNECGLTKKQSPSSLSSIQEPSSRRATLSPPSSAATTFSGDQQIPGFTPEVPVPSTFSNAPSSSSMNSPGASNPSEASTQLPESSELNSVATSPSCRLYKSTSNTSPWPPVARKFMQSPSVGEAGLNLKGESPNTKTLEGTVDGLIEVSRCCNEVIKEVEVDGGPEAIDNLPREESEVSHVVPQRGGSCEKAVWVGTTYTPPRPPAARKVMQSPCVGEAPVNLQEEIPNTEKLKRITDWVGETGQEWDEIRKEVEELSGFEGNDKVCKKLKRIKDGMEKLNQCWNEIMLEGEEDSGTGDDDNLPKEGSEVSSQVVTQNEGPSEKAVWVGRNVESLSSLPIRMFGYRFCPTAEELITHYLRNKVMDQPLPSDEFTIVRDIYGERETATPWILFTDNDPWLPVVDSFHKLFEHQKVLYVFTKLLNVGTAGDKNKKRVAGCGNWHANAKEPVTMGNQLIGYKRIFTFQSNEETVGQWTMYEFELAGISLEGINLNNKYVLCKIKRDDSKCTKGGRVIYQNNSTSNKNDGVVISKAVQVKRSGDSLRSLAIGLRFCPTDEELIIHYLKNKLTEQPLPSYECIIVRDIYGNSDSKTPWILFSDADPWQPLVAFGTMLVRQKVLYVFTRLSSAGKSGDKKKRIAGCGNWHANGTEHVMKNGQIIGNKRAFTFWCKEQTVGQWTMHEYEVAGATLEGINPYNSNYYVLCEIRRDDSRFSKGGRLVSRGKIKL